MKHLSILSLFTFHFALFTLSASAAVPLKWTVETSRAVPAQFEAYQGETLALEAALQSYGKPLEAPSNYSLYWQTNGMGSTYWSVPVRVPSSSTGTGTSNSNLMFATWSPTNDVGARVYNCFIGQPGTIYHAAFQLRLRPSPGALPNALPLPQPVIDFAKVTVLNPPWSGGGGGGVDTNAVRDIIHETVDGAARTLPKYLHALDFDDSYPEAAAEYYRSRGNGKVDGGCSSVRDGGFLYRNFDYPFDERAEFVVRMSAGPNRLASVGVAQVGENLTEQFVVSGKPSRCYKWLPGATVDGVNEKGVVAEINVVDTPVTGWHTTGDLHPLAAVRWVLDNATNAQSAAEYIAANIAFPAGWTQNFHYMIADSEKTYIVENGTATNGDEYHEPDEPVTMTNFQLNRFPWDGMGMERFGLLLGGENITNAWYTRAYRRETVPQWKSEFSADVLERTNEIFNAWAEHPKEYFRGRKADNGDPWWQTVHTSVYDITNRTLRICVQEVDDWYTFAVPSAGGVKPDAVREIVEPMIGVATNGIPEQIAALQSGKRDKTDYSITDKKWVAYDLISFVTEVVGSPWYNNNGTWSCYYRVGAGGSLYVAEAVGEEDTELLEFSNTLTIVFRTRLTYVQDSYHVLARRVVYAASALAKFDADGNIVSATPGTDFVAPVAGKSLSSNDYTDADKAEVAKVKDKADEFTEWEVESSPDHSDEFTVEWKDAVEYQRAGWYVFFSGQSVTWQAKGNRDSVSLSWDSNDFDFYETINSCTATRKRVLRTGDAATPQELTNAISTNNPAFVSAVRSLIPTTLRAYDPVRQCWWVLEMVNGVPTWTVED